MRIRIQIRIAIPSFNITMNLTYIITEKDDKNYLIGYISNGRLILLIFDMRKNIYIRKP